MPTSMKGTDDRKRLVQSRLQEAIAFCNSHHDYAQERFERVADSLLTPEKIGSEWETRRHEMKALFPILLDENMRGYVPSIKLNDTELALKGAEFLDCWCGKWVKKYLSAWRSWPSEREAKAKGAATDEALIQLLVPHAGSEAQARLWAKHHNFYMSAENTGGLLLEEYIARKTMPYGWIWCRGEILTAVDFCRDDCSAFIQVKNKSNTENSSSKGFRDSHNAPMWYRMEAERKAGHIVTRWPDLVAFIADHSDNGDSVPIDLMTESDYLAFVRGASERNGALVNGEEEGLISEEIAF